MTRSTMVATMGETCPLHGEPIRPAEIDGKRVAVCMACIRKEPERNARRRPQERSRLEDELALQIALRGLPEPEREYRFLKPRRYRADFAWPAKRVLVEVEGGIYSNGRHVRGKGYANDCRKYSLAAADGWKVLRFTAADIEDGSAALMIERALTHDA